MNESVRQPRRFRKVGVDAVDSGLYHVLNLPGLESYHLHCLPVDMCHDLADQALGVIMISSLFEAYPNLTQAEINVTSVIEYSSCNMNLSLDMENRDIFLLVT
jgi:hypothetical protein